MMDIDELLAISFGVATFNRENVYFWVVIGKSSSAAVHVSISQNHPHPSPNIG